MLRKTQHEQPAPVFHGGTNPSVQARHCCRLVPLSQTDLPPVLLGCHHPRGPLLPCLCVPWPLPVVELISLDSMASLYPSLSHICGLLPQPPHPPVSHPSLGLFPRSPPPNQLFSPAPPPLCHGALLLPSSLLHRLSSISFWHWHFLVPTINCSPCRSWWHKVLFHCCSSPHPLQPGLHVS